MLKLSLYEIRILGVLFEKERSTPDQYPLSLNALTAGCNQKSNRDPVMSLQEVQIQEAVNLLIDKGLVSEIKLGNRIIKYRQRLGNTQFSHFDLSLKEHSILTVLFLRGPQTAGELRTRTTRLYDFKDVQQVEDVLEELIDRPGDAFVSKLPKEPGKRESRYMHLFHDEVDATEFSSNAKRDVNSKNMDDDKRLITLEKQVASMQEEIDKLKSLWKELID